MSFSEEPALVFVGEDGEEKEFYIQDQTRLNGTDYILVADSNEDEAEAYILKDTSTAEDETAVYVMVEDEVELEAVAGVFRRMLEDVELQ